MTRITVDPEVGQVELMAAYLDEPITVGVDDRGVPRDEKGSAFDDFSYWVVAGSKVMA